VIDLAMSSSKRFLYQLLITLLLLASLEAAARLAFTVYSGPLYAGTKPPDAWFIPSSDIGWDRRPNFNGLDECEVRRTFDSRGLVSVDAARLQNGGSQNLRVVFLGDSNTYGHCLTTETTFVEVAAILLPKFDLINLGVLGYTSYQGYRQLLKHGDLIRPDLIFISFNFNDRRYVTGNNDIDSDAAFKTMVVKTRTFQVLEYSYLYRVVRALARRSSPDPAPTLLRVDTLKPRVDPQSYRSNLIRMIEWARNRGSIPIFILLGDNPGETALLRRGVARLEAKDYESAIKDLTLIVNRSKAQFAPLARLYLSIAYREIGRMEVAEQALLIEPRYSNHGGVPIFLDSDYNKIMRDVAQEYDVTLIDAKSKLEEAPRVFFDPVHFDAEGHEIVGRLIAGVLAKSK
jgi:lysophospholipase L1-like esterase